MNNYSHQTNLIKENPKRYGIFWGTGCLSGDTFIPLWRGGFKRAKHISAGDLIIAYDQFSGKYKPGAVKDVSVSRINPKPMIELEYDKEKITTTYDHPFFDGKAFYPLYQLIWGALEESQKLQLKLLCEQYGADFNYKKTWRKYSCCDEASRGCSRLFTNSSRWKNSKSTSCSCRDMVKESAEISYSKPHQRNKKRQSSKQPGMVFETIQCLARIQTGVNKKTSTSTRASFNSETKTIHTSVLYQKYAALPCNTRQKTGLQFSANEVSSSKKKHVIRTSYFKIKIKKQEPYYSIHIAQAPYTYCIGKKHCFITHNSGKTRTALQLAQGKILIICPKTQMLDKTWEREQEKLGVHKNITVMSKEQFKKMAKQLPKFDTVIGDEAHTLCGVTPYTRFKNKVRIPKASQIFEALDWYIRTYTPERVYLVTATPIPQPMAVWAAAKLLGHQYDFVSFRNTFFQRINMRGRELYLPKKDSKSKDVLASVVQKIGVTGRLQDWFDVPPQTFKTVTVGMTKAQESKIIDIDMLYPDPIVRIGKMHQLEQGIFEGKFLEQNKFEAITDLADEFDKVLVFCKYTMQIEQLHAYLTTKKYKSITLTGQTKDRRTVMENAEKADKCIVIAQAQISAGYELPSYRCTVFCSKSYSYVDYDQSLGRTLRANNLQKNVYVTLHSSEVDEAVSDSVDNKKDFSERIYAEKRGYIYNESTEMGENEDVVAELPL